MDNIVRSKINLSDLKAGDTVEYLNEITTVCKKDISFCPFMGFAFRGDASKKDITRIQFAVPTNKGIILR